METSAVMFMTFFRPIVLTFTAGEAPLDPVARLWGVFTGAAASGHGHPAISIEHSSSACHMLVQYMLANAAVPSLKLQLKMYTLGAGVEQ